MRSILGGRGYISRCGGAGTFHYLGVLFFDKGGIVSIILSNMCGIMCAFEETCRNYGQNFGKMWQKLPRRTKDMQKLFDDLVAF